MPFGDVESWTVLDAGWWVIEPVEAFLSHLHAVERSPNTVKAYAHDLRDYFEFLAQAGLGWASVRLEDVGRFVAWLRLPPLARREGVTVLPGAPGYCSSGTAGKWAAWTLKAGFRSSEAGAREPRSVRCCTGPLQSAVVCASDD